MMYLMSTFALESFVKVPLRYIIRILYWLCTSPVLSDRTLGQKCR